MRSSNFCGSAARGPICEAILFRHTRRSTTLFRKFQREGVWDRIWEELLVALREHLGREASPTAAIINSQSLKAAKRRV
jgi:transposase